MQLAPLLAARDGSSESKARQHQPASNLRMRHLGRVFGARDLALAGALLTTDDEARTRLVRACIAIEVHDTASALIARRSGTTDTRATTVLIRAVVAAPLPEAIALHAGRQSADRVVTPRRRWVVVRQ